MIVQGQNEKFYQVDVEAGACGCTGFKLKNRCNHLEVARDIFVEHGKFHRWDIMSSFHKEIRRCDLDRGVQWARAFARISGADQPASYCRKILFEECRNLELFRQYKLGELELKDQIHRMILSRKKWELPYMNRHFEYWNEGFHSYYDNREKWDESYMMERIMKAQTPPEVYEILFFIMKNDTFLSWFWSKLSERASADKNERLQGYLELDPETPNAYYGKMVALELMIGYWSQEANEYWPTKEVKPSYIPSIRGYAYDCHNWRGKKMLYADWDRVKPNEDFTATKIDMRWSGMLYGIYWRFKCFEQHGYLTTPEGIDVPWDKVQLDLGEWDRTQKHDSYYYSSFYRELAEKGFKVFTWQKGSK